MNGTGRIKWETLTQILAESLTFGKCSIRADTLLTVITLEVNPEPTWVKGISLCGCVSLERLLGHPAPPLCGRSSWRVC